ncbi:MULTISPECIES: penicillin-binding protein activator [Vibrio]|uniref:Penicillin-binding protein activator LpoA n=2 Tax=Vibrio TaxID=662 RepID=A0A7X4RSP9_9VIBR|nr:MULTISPECIES: penicillin-binding protein activator [Vibrio]MBF9001520.1 penicillin-binding protein activator [Vibrio nitrifigilis]MZI91806.1 YraN family protein [Vibrio eleionomae]
MKNHQRRSVPRLLTPVALAIALAACSSKPSAPDYVDITSEPSETAQIYIMQADTTQGSLQNDLLIMAMKASIAANNTEQAELISKRLSKQKLSNKQTAEWQLNKAQLLTNVEQYDKAMQQLDFKPYWKLADQQWKEYHQLKADIYTSLDKPFDSSRELVALYQYTMQNQWGAISDQIWNNLSHYNSHSITDLTTTPDEDVLDGWLQLAIYMKTLGSDLPQLQNTLKNWLRENPNHPAALNTPQDVQDILAMNISKPNNTALLLPLTGKYARQAQLIRDGFIMSMMNDQTRLPSAKLTVIDTNAESLEKIEQTLEQKHIDFVVGPLEKDKVEALQKVQEDSDNPIKTLSLNIPETVESGYQTCYLTLSPEQEVAQAAKHLFSEGYQYPLILAPEGSYGERVVEAFNEEWRKYSKNKVAVSLFSNKRTLQRNINSVFGLQDSQQNIAQMEELTGMKLKSQPRSRRDIDAVYIVANSAELTLIKPFIEVAINPDTQPPRLFSNSTSNGGGRQYEDLTGVTYSDIPLLVHPSNSISNQMERLWPNDTNGERRLQALGMDAYRLMNELPQMKVVQGYTINGETGVLSIDDSCVVQREISWTKH